MRHDETRKPHKWVVTYGDEDFVVESFCSRLAADAWGREHLGEVGDWGVVIVKRVGSSKDAVLYRVTVTCVTRQEYRLSHRAETGHGEAYTTVLSPGQKLCYVSDSLPVPVALRAKTETTGEKAA